MPGVTTTFHPGILWSNGQVRAYYGRSTRSIHNGTLGHSRSRGRATRHARTTRHDPRGHYLYLSGAKRLDELPSAQHPVVRSHPLTGDRALYVNDGFVGKIVELDRAESKALLNLLYDKVAYSVSCQCRVQWQPNTVVFWDNRIVQHHAAFDYWPATRRGYRVTIEGEKPVLV